MEQSYGGQERRYYKRCSVELPVKLSFISDEVKTQVVEFYEAHTIDISGGGLAIKVQSLDREIIPQINVGVIRCGIKLHIPIYAEQIMMLTKSAWIMRQLSMGPEDSGYIIGVQFTDITTVNKDKIIGFIVGSYLGKQ
ncbi:MAG: PilZ domain-containing protein [PVC group bacterium]|nr:PilZ domain-containing protein [PVC group bacterium]